MNTTDPSDNLPESPTNPAADHAKAIADAREYLDRGLIIPGYVPFDREAHLGELPWTDKAAIAVWEKAHGHDVRLKCYIEFECLVIESQAMSIIAGLLDAIDTAE